MSASGFVKTFVKSSHGGVTPPIAPLDEADHDRKWGDLKFLANLFSKKVGGGQCPEKDPLDAILKDVGSCTSSVCYMTAGLITNHLKKNGYMSEKPSSSENVYDDLILEIKKDLDAKQCLFLFVGIYGHVFLIEVNGQENYIRLYQSYGGRYTFAEWMNPKAILQESKPDDLSPTDYTYNVKKAQSIKDQWGSSIKISGDSLEKFYQALKKIGDAKTFDQFDEAQENFFGAKTPLDKKTQKPIHENMQKSGKITIWRAKEASSS